MSTLTERAKSGLDFFVAQAAQSSLAYEGRCDLQSIDSATIPSPSVVMLTVSSYTFRVLMFIHFAENASTRECVGKLVGESPDDLVGDRFHDALMERGNLLCGAVNRDLANFFPHIGMSTPCVLTCAAVEQLDSVKPAYVRRLRAALSTECSLYITYALCTASKFDFPFDSNRAVASVAESVGELEMF